MKADTHIAPYLAKSITPVFGLNHLGLRNAAEDLFTTLLPGLNGVTQRVRYYSFYCWITGQFVKLFTGDGRTDLAYRLFIRKGEMLLALIQAHRNPDVTGIPGISYALTTLGQEGDTFDLLRCVDRPENARRTQDTYWANPGGILSQYYGSSMKDMALLPTLKGSSAVSVPSQKGDFLPEGTLPGGSPPAAFARSAGNGAAELFLSCVQRSVVSRKELDGLKDRFVMKDFGDIGSERELLIRMLEQKDYPAIESSRRHLRRDTVRRFLSYCKRDRRAGTRDSVQFPTVVYRQVLDGTLLDECSLGWYAYHINDRWQYHSSVIFACVLETLQRDGGWVRVGELVDSLAEGMYRALLPRSGATVGDVADRIDSGETAQLAFKTIEEEAADAMVSLLRLYCENRRKRETVEAYKAAFKDLKTCGRNDFFAFMAELDSQLEVPFLDFLKEYILKKIIYRHHTVSLMKYSATRVASNKFLLEDGYIRFLEQTECTATAPRIDSLVEYLTDLGLLKDMEPTGDALNRYELD